VSALEHAETKGSITLKSLRRAARGLHCDLVYALVPRAGLETMFDGRVRTVAAAIVKRASHSMALERQEVSDQETTAQVEELADRLRSESPRNLWNEVESDGSAA
jgi:predicted DNA-binding mobile mystery protein A